jgi:uncharacterized protein
METNNNLVPKPLVWILGIFLLFFIGIYAAGKAYSISQDMKNNQQPKKTISMSAEGKVSATPDLATVNLGVLTRGTTAAGVQDQNSKKVNQIIDFAKGLGIKKEDITTTNFNVYPQYNYASGKNTIIGYEANQTVSVKVHGVDQSTDNLGKLIDGATNNGANEVNGISLSFNDPDNLRQQARKQAIDKAKGKAQELADQAGLKLGKVVTISESSGGYPTPMPYAANEAMGLGGAGNMMKSVAPTIEPGSQDITAQMTVVYELK